MVLVGGQMSVELHVAVDRLRKSGLLRSQGFVGGKWIDAYDGMTLQVPLEAYAFLFPILEGVPVFLGVDVPMVCLLIVWTMNWLKV